MKENFTDMDFLCPECSKKLNTHHVIQCSHCNSIVDFIELEDGEEANVFYIKKCHHCNGSTEDERRIQPFMFPEIFM